MEFLLPAPIADAVILGYSFIGAEIHWGRTQHLSVHYLRLLVAPKAGYPPLFGLSCVHDILRLGP